MLQPVHTELNDFTFLDFTACWNCRQWFFTTAIFLAG